MILKKILCLWILIMAALIAAPSIMAEQTVEVYPFGSEEFSHFIPEGRFLRNNDYPSKIIPCTADVAELFAAINGSYSFTYWGKTYYFAENPESPPGPSNPPLEVPSGKSYAGGGKVIMKPGIFESGNVVFDKDRNRNAYPWVPIGQSVEVTGENAIFRHGGFDIYASEDADIKINNLTLENTIWAAISAESDFNSLTIDNVIINGIQTLYEWWDWESYMRYGIHLGWWEEPPMHGKSVSISNCYIDLVGKDGNGDPISPYEVDLDPSPWGRQSPWGQGIVIYGIGKPANEVDVSVKGNTVMNCSIHSIQVQDIAGSVTITDNTIISGDHGVDWFDTTLNGIWGNQTPWRYFDFDFPFGAWDTYHPDWIKLIIKNNDVRCGSSPYADPARPFGIIAFNQVGTVIKNNKIRVDDGYVCISVYENSDGFVVKSNTCAGSGSFGAIEVWAGAKNCAIKNNDTSKATPLENHLWIQQDAHNISVKNNDFGPGGSLGGIRCEGFKNHIGNNTFHGDYPGWPDSGFVLLDEQSQENHVVALKKATPPHGFDLCDQVMDLGTNNKIPGYEKCNH